MLFTSGGESSVQPGVLWTGRWWETRTATPVGAPVSLEREVSQVAWTPDGRGVVLVTASGPERPPNQVIELRQAPQPVSGAPQRLALWALVVTGTELDADGLVQALDAATWLERRRQLEALDRPPGP
jgi:hypothetical protein